MPRARPLRVVAFGGGTGLSTLLRGFAGLRGVEVCAVVAVSDDGGSSGRLRRELGIPAVGDARACLSALSLPPWSALLEQRFRSGALRGHAVGNLLLAAACESHGSISSAIERVASLSAPSGRVLACTNAAVTLVATLADGTSVEGQASLSRHRGRIARLQLHPAGAQAGPGVLSSIAAADLVVMGPGSLFSSVLASLLPVGVAPVLRRSRAVRVLVKNLVNETGETGRMGVEAHLAACEAHLGPGCVEHVLIDRHAPAPRRSMPAGVRVWQARIAAPDGVRHDPRRLAQALLGLTQRFQGARPGR